MGNSDSRCCDGVKDKKKESVSTCGIQNTDMCNSASKTQFHNSAQSKDDEYSHSEKKESIFHSVSSHSSNVSTNPTMHTPVHDHVNFSQQEKKNVHDYDPRSPSNGITRTPIHIAEEEIICNLVDPRSPTSGVKRTPLVVLEKCAGKSDTNPVVRNFHDPRSPTTALSRTPLSLLSTGNLRRTVLLSNLMSSPVSRKSPIGSDDNGLSPSKGEIETQCPKEANVFNFSDEVDWNTSLSSSTAANAGSDPQLSFSYLSQNLSMPEHMDENTDEIIAQYSDEDIAEGVDVNTSSCHKNEIAISMMKIQSPVHHSVLSSDAILGVADQNVSDELGNKTGIESKQPQDFEQDSRKNEIDFSVGNQEVDKVSLKNECDAEISLPIESQRKDQNKGLVIKKPKSQIPSGIKSSALLRKRSFSSGHPFQTKEGNERIPLSSLSPSAKVNISDSKINPTQENGPQKKFIKNVLKDTKRTRSPLAVLSHSNSPELRRVNISNADMGDVRPTGLKLTTSRLPRYKGNLVGRPRSSSLSSTRILFQDSKMQRARQSGKENQ